MTGAVAALPMYLRDETRAPLARLWTAARARLAESWRGPPLPAALSEPADLMRHWRAPGLVLSQSCGLPYRTRLHGRVALVGTPDFGLPGCAAGYYNSVLVMRADDRRGAPTFWPGLRLAVNDRRSQSGRAAPLAHADQLGTGFGAEVVTGSHRVSAAAVVHGRADIAAIDAQVWRMIRRWDGSLARRLREVGRTDPTPGLPLITAAGNDADALFAALSQGLADIEAQDRRTLDIRGIVRIASEHYLAVPTPPEADAPE